MLTPLADEWRSSPVLRKKNNDLSADDNKRLIQNVTLAPPKPRTPVTIFLAEKSVCSNDEKKGANYYKQIFANCKELVKIKYIEEAFQEKCYYEEKM